MTELHELLHKLCIEMEVIPMGTDTIMEIDRRLIELDRLYKTPKPHANTILIADVIEIIQRIDTNLLEISLSVSSILYKLDKIAKAIGVVEDE